MCGEICDLQGCVLCVCVGGVCVEGGLHSVVLICDI